MNTFWHKQGKGSPVLEFLFGVIIFITGIQLEVNAFLYTLTLNKDTDIFSLTDKGDAAKSFVGKPDHRQGQYKGNKGDNNQKWM